MFWFPDRLSIDAVVNNSISVLRGGRHAGQMHAPPIAHSPTGHRCSAAPSAFFHFATLASPRSAVRSRRRRFHEYPVLEKFWNTATILIVIVNKRGLPSQEFRLTRPAGRGHWGPISVIWPVLLTLVGPRDIPKSPPRVDLTRVPVRSGESDSTCVLDYPRFSRDSCVRSRRRAIK